MTWLTGTSAPARPRGSVITICSGAQSPEIFGSPLGSRGAQTQRLLWASTGAKNPAYRDVVYVEELIGPDTVNTMPPATIDAFRDHGQPRASLLEDIDAARDTMSTLADVGISMKEVTDTLLADGLRLFAEAFEQLLRSVEKQSHEAGAGRINRMTSAVGVSFAGSPVATVRPSLSTVTRSPISRISSSRCEM